MGILSGDPVTVNAIVPSLDAVVDLVPELNEREMTANKGIANGYAGLGSDAKVPTTQLGGTGADNTKFLRGDKTWAAPTATAADPSYSPGSFTVENETSRTSSRRIKLTGSQRVTILGTGCLRIT